MNAAIPVGGTQWSLVWMDGWAVCERPLGGHHVWCPYRECCYYGKELHVNYGKELHVKPRTGINHNIVAQRQLGGHHIWCPYRECCYSGEELHVSPRTRAISVQASITTRPHNCHFRTKACRYTLQAKSKTNPMSTAAHGVHLLFGV